MENLIRLILASSLFLYLEYWVNLYRKINRNGSSSKGNLLALIILLTVLCFVGISQIVYPEKGKLETLDNYLTRILGLICFIFGMLLSVWGKETLGKNWSTAWECQIKEGHQLITSGPYKFIRHPIYSGLFLISLGFGLALANILSLVVLSLFPIGFYFQAKKEEQLLESHFSDKYKSYKSKTKMFIPKLV